MRQRWPSSLLPAFAVLCWPAPALANAGTPLMWAGMFQLTFGNAIIGWGEGALLARVFGAPKRASVLLMIAANYLSMGVGWLAFPWLTTRFAGPLLGDQPLYHIGALLAGTLSISFLASVLIEWPFCLWALRRVSPPWTRSLKASALVQTASYAVLVPLYALISPITVITGVELDRSLAFAHMDYAWVYYISPSSGDVYRIRPDGVGRERVAEAGIAEPDASLTARWIADGPRVDLWVTSSEVGFNERLLVQDLPIRPSEAWRADIENLYAERKGWTRWGHGLDFRGEDRRDLWLYASPWPGGGLLVSNSRTGNWFHVALETPLVQWAARNPSMVSDELVIFQLGDQVVALNPTGRKMGLVTLGRGPIVVLEEPEITAAR